MGAELSAPQARIIEVLQPVPEGGEDDADGRLETLLQLLPDEDPASPFGTLALIAACNGGHAQCTMALIMAGCDPSAASESVLGGGLVGDTSEGESGITPLIAAAAAGQAECLRECLRAGADPTAKTSLERTALDAAKAHGGEEAIRVLREAPHTKAAGIARRTSAYTKTHLGLDRLHRQAIAVHVIDYTEMNGQMRFIIESEDNFRGDRHCYIVTRSVPEFRQLHEEMTSDYPTLPKTFPVSGKSKGLTAAVKVERMIALEKYLRLVLGKVEESVGGKYSVFRRDTSKLAEPARSPAELPYEIVMFLGLEDTGFPDSCRAAIQALRHKGEDGAPAPRPTSGSGEAGCPMQ